MTLEQVELALDALHKARTKIWRIRGDYMTYPDKLHVCNEAEDKINKLMFMVEQDSYDNYPPEPA